jgi:TrmH family RNA methyltransferase
MLFDAVSGVLKRITSRHNPRVEQYRAAARGELAGRLLLDGPHLVRDALEAALSLEHAAVVSTALDRVEIRGLMDDLERAHVESAVVTPPVMAAMSPVRSPGGIVALARRPATDPSRLYAGAAPLVLVACDVQDPGNLGAIIRAAEAGCATAVVAAGACADPWGWKALRGSAGSALRLPIGTSANPISALDAAHHHRCRVLAAVPRHGRSLYDCNLRPASAIMIGGEGPGLDAAVLDRVDEHITIPMRSTVESLNAAVAAAVLVYEALRQRR